MSGVSAKPLFRAISGAARRENERAALPALDLPGACPGRDPGACPGPGPGPRSGRDPGARGEGPPATGSRAGPNAAPRRDLDLYPTGEPEAVRALLARDGERIREAGGGRVWEPAAGRGDMVRALAAGGLEVVASDIADHGCPPELGRVMVRSFYDFADAPCGAVVTNPPYGEINARDGRGRWLRHTLALPSWRYCALLLSWDWPAARANGLAELIDAQPFSWCYLLRWKLDFTGEGSPPQRNAWFVWDRDWRAEEPAFRFLDRVDGRQGVLL